MNTVDIVTARNKVACRNCQSTLWRCYVGDLSARPSIVMICVDCDVPRHLYLATTKDPITIDPDL